MSYFNYEMTVDEDGYWFEVRTEDLNVAKTMQWFCEWLCGKQLKKDKCETQNESQKS